MTASLPPETPRGIGLRIAACEPWELVSDIQQRFRKGHVIHVSELSKEGQRGVRPTQSFSHHREHRSDPDTGAEQNNMSIGCCLQEE